MRRRASRAAARRLALGVLFLAALPWAAPRAASAEVLLEEVVQAGDYTFYRDSSDAHAYRYAPTGLRLAEGSDGEPQLLFVKYTRAEAEPSAVGQGGLLHALVTWGLDRNELSRAQTALRREDPDARLLGPVSLTRGEIAVVSAAASAEGGLVREIVGTGTCSILPGSKCALGMALSAEGATILWETLQRSTADVSAAFHVTFKGLTPAFKAHLVVDWDQVYSHRDIKAGINAEYKFVEGKANVNAILDDLQQSGALDLQVDGADQDMEALWRTVYDHVTNLMFKATVGAGTKSSGSSLGKKAAGTGAIPGISGGRLAAVAPAVLFAAAQETPKEEAEEKKEAAAKEADEKPAGSALRKGGLRANKGEQKKPEAQGAQASESGKEKESSGSGSAKTAEPAKEEGERAKSRDGEKEKDDEKESLADKVPKGLEVSVDYVYRRERRTGRYTVDFRKRVHEDRELMLTEDLAGFFRSPEDLARHLVEVDLDDPFFQNRPVDVLLDQASWEDLEHYVNAVSVQMRRRHDDGAATEKSVVFTPEDFAAEGNRRRLLYPRLGDRPESWLGYSYKVDWHFFGGALAEGEWRETDQPVLTLSPPADYRTLRINADQDDLAAHGVVAVSVQLRHRLFGKPILREVFLDPRSGDPLSTQITYLHEPGDPAYEVQVVWTTRDGVEVVEEWAERRGSYVALRFPDAPNRAS